MDLCEGKSLQKENIKVNQNTVRNRFVDRVLRKSTLIPEEEKKNKSWKKKGSSKYVRRGEQMNFLSESTELNLAILFFSLFALICTCCQV